jgi:TadE-like protein
VAVEAVMIVPVVMFVLTVMVQVVLWANAFQVAHLAASEGVRAAVSGGGGAALAASRARTVLATSGSDVESPRIGALILPGDQIRVSVSGHALSLLPWLSLPVSAIQVGPIQEFRSSE